MRLEKCSTKIIRRPKHKSGEIEAMVQGFLETGDQCNEIKGWRMYYSTPESLRSSFNRVLDNMKCRDRIAITVEKEEHVFIYIKGGNRDE